LLEAFGDLAVDGLEVRRRVLDERLGEFVHQSHPGDVKHSARQVCQRLLGNAFLAGQYPLVIGWKSVRSHPC